MDRKKILDYVQMKYNTLGEKPWSKYPHYLVLRHKNNTKWYGIIMNVLPKKLGIKGEEYVDIIDLKCDPELITNLIDYKSFFPAYHMNKEHWISILINKNISENNLFNLIDKSYDLTL